MEVETVETIAQVNLDIDVVPSWLKLCGEQLLIGTTTGQVHSWDIETQTNTGTHQVHKFGVNAIQNDVYHNFWFSAGDDGLIKALSQNGQEEHIFKGHRGYVQSLAVDPMNSLLLSGSSDKSAIIWDIRIGNDIATLHNIHKLAVNSVSFSHDSTLFLTASFDGTINIWDTISQNSINMLSPGARIPVSAANFTHNSKYIYASCLNSQIVLWDILDRKTPMIKKYNGHANTMYKLPVLQYNRASLLAGSEDGKIHRWNINTEKMTNTWEIGTEIIHLAEQYDDNIFVVGGHRATGSFIKLLRLIDA